ncbi:TspO/MBR family protein [Caulobacter sp. KR2-114]|uniref:TspO/MBR family protein n=1 Tax=Caulobacter sp. KR2-114 TaxID=3400912 RepID=UPI003C046461
MARGWVGRAINARDEAASHVMVGIGLTVGAVLVSALVARQNAPTVDNPRIKAQYDRLKPTPLQPPPAVFAAVWPPLFMALTLSGLRIWNAPASAARTRALTLWGLIQGFNALWMALGPRRLGGQLTTAVATLGAAGAYALQARKVDAPASALVSPYLGWIGFANVLTEELWRSNQAGHTVH